MEPQEEEGKWNADDEKRENERSSGSSGGEYEPRHEREETKGWRSKTITGVAAEDEER